MPAEVAGVDEDVSGGDGARGGEPVGVRQMHDPHGSRAPIACGREDAEGGLS